MKQLGLTVLFPPWGSTSRLVKIEATTLVELTKTPGPFNMPPMSFDMYEVETKMKTVCASATDQIRVGMMISSRFRVERTDTEVQVWHVRETQGDRLWLVFRYEKEEPVTVATGSTKY